MLPPKPPNKENDPYLCGSCHISTPLSVSDYHSQFYSKLHPKQAGDRRAQQPGNRRFCVNMIISRKWLHIFKRTVDSQLEPALAPIILQMQHSEERQEEMEGGGSGAIKRKSSQSAADWVVITVCDSILDLFPWTKSWLLYSIIPATRLRRLSMKEWRRGGKKRDFIFLLTWERSICDTAPSLKGICQGQLCKVPSVWKRWGGKAPIITDR